MISSTMRTCKNRLKIKILSLPSIVGFYIVSPTHIQIRIKIRIRIRIVAQLWATNKTSLGVGIYLSTNALSRINRQVRNRSSFRSFRRMEMGKRELPICHRSRAIILPYFAYINEKCCLQMLVLS